MRPQHFAAEYVTPGGWTSRCAGGFNEAAAFRCGIPETDIPKWRLRMVASMRPQHFAAEYSCDARNVFPAECGFNEAAAFRCGIHRVAAEANIAIMKLQ